MMNKQERIDELKKQIEKLKAEINKIEHEDTLERYKNDVSGVNVRYTLDKYSDVTLLDPDIQFNSNRYNPYCNYLTKEYAEEATRIKKFNDMLMAFKWCYDSDYVPNWDCSSTKYFIVYNPVFHVYHVCSTFSYCHNIIYFSNQDIAQSCADWFTDIDPNGELIK